MRPLRGKFGGELGMKAETGERVDITTIPHKIYGDSWLDHTKTLGENGKKFSFHPLPLSINVVEVM